MARGRQKDEWQRASLICTLLNNAWFEKKVTPDDMSPFGVPARRKKPKKTITHPAQLGWGPVYTVQ